MANTAKLLILQGGHCFYCRRPLALEDATLEHIVPKVLGGDASEGNAVACCAAMNHLLGSATPKEKLAAILNGGGVLSCPRKQLAPMLEPQSEAIPKVPPGLLALHEPLDDAYDAAAKMHGGARANLSALGLELRKKVKGFSSKAYGHKQFGPLVAALGYQVSGQWATRLAREK
jgi:HNH endonuclease